MEFRNKPLGIKAYGHIGHFLGSKMGIRHDKRLPNGLTRMMTEKLQSKKDFLSVSAKLDGSCVAVHRQGNILIPMVKAGYHAYSSPYKQHQYFALWVFSNLNRFFSVLKDGERIVGEWILMAHGTKYKIESEPFYAFDIMTEHDRLPYLEFRNRVEDYFQYPCPLFFGHDVCSIDKAMQALGELGKHGEQELAEGAVWRLERTIQGKFRVDLGKYVRPEKEIGKYLSRTKDVWNIDIKQFMHLYCGVNYEKVL